MAENHQGVLRSGNVTQSQKSSLETKPLVADFQCHHDEEKPKLSE